MCPTGAPALGPFTSLGAPLGPLQPSPYMNSRIKKSRESDFSSKIFDVRFYGDGVRSTG